VFNFYVFSAVYHGVVKIEMIYIKTCSKFLPILFTKTTFFYQGSLGFLKRLRSRIEISSLLSVLAHLAPDYPLRTAHYDQPLQIYTWKEWI